MNDLFAFVALASVANSSYFGFIALSQNVIVDDENKTNTNNEMMLNGNEEVNDNRNKKQ